MPNEYSNFTNPDVGGPLDGRTAPVPGQTPDGKVWDPSAFNPQTGTNSGAYVTVNQQTPGNASSASRTFQAGAWGDEGNSLDANGNPILGTSGADKDANRFRDMGQNPTNESGPVIDQTRSNETRGISTDAIGLLQDSATGASPSQAMLLGTRQAQDAQNAQQSIAGSVRGGPMARAAAARNAQMNAAKIGAQQNQANAATRAGEMATARGALMGATTGQRGQDIGVSTSQANLDAGQRGQNDQHEGFYENLAFNTKAAELGHQLGRTAEENAAANAAHSTAMAADAAAQGRLDRNINVGIGGAQGAAAAYNKVNAPSTTKPNPDDDFGSDERMKTKVTPLGKFDTQLAAEDEPKFAAWKSTYAPKDSGEDYDLRGAFRAGLKPDPKTGHWDDRFKKPNHPTFSTESQYAPAGNPGRWQGDKFIPAMSDKEAAKLKGQAEGMSAGIQANLDAGPSVGPNKKPAQPVMLGTKARKKGGMDPTNPYDDYDRSVFARSTDRETAPNTAALHAGIEAQIAKDHPALPEKMDPTNPYAHKSLFGDAPEGYAASRRGKPGSMFSRAPEASYKDRLWGPGEKDEETGLAPGSEDLDTSGGRPDRFSRRIMLSDERAKNQARREAFEEGVNYHANLGQKTGDGYLTSAEGLPEYMSTKPRGESPAGKAAGSSFARKDSAPQRMEVAAREGQGRTGRSAIVDGAKTMAIPLAGPASVAIGAGGMLGGANAAYDAEGPNQAPMPVPQDTQRNLPVPVGVRPVKSFQRGPDPIEVATSDKRAKKIEKEHEPMIRANLSMKPSVYEYKAEFAGENGQKVGEKNVGPMAQNMAADPLAKTAVVKDPKNGLLGLSMPKMLKLVGGGLASLQAQVLEMKRKKASR